MLMHEPGDRRHGHDHVLVGLMGRVKREGLADVVAHLPYALAGRAIVGHVHLRRAAGQTQLADGFVVVLHLLLVGPVKQGSAVADVRIRLSE